MEERGLKQSAIMHSVKRYNLPGPLETPSTRQPGPASQSGYYSVQQRTLNHWNAPLSLALNSGQSVTTSPQCNSSSTCLQSSPVNKNHPPGPQQTLSCREPGPDSQSGYYIVQQRTLNQWNASQSHGLSSGQSFTPSPQSNSSSAGLQSSPGNRNHPLGPQQTLSCREPGPDSQSGGCYSVQQRTLNQWNAPQLIGQSSGQSFSYLPPSNSSSAHLQSSPVNRNHPPGPQQTLSCREPGPDSQSVYFSEQLMALRQWSGSLGPSSGQTFAFIPQSNSSVLSSNGNRNHPPGPQQSAYNSMQQNLLIQKSNLQGFSHENSYSLSSQPSSGSANPQVRFTGPQSQLKFRTQASFTAPCPNAAVQPQQFQVVPVKAPSTIVKYHSQLPHKNTSLQDNKHLTALQNMNCTTSWFPSNGTSVLENNNMQAANLSRYHPLRQKPTENQTLPQSADQPQQTSPNDLVSEAPLRLKITQGQVQGVRNGTTNSCAPGPPPVTQTSMAPPMPPPYRGPHITVNSYLNHRVPPLNRPSNFVVQKEAGQLVYQSSSSLPQCTENLKVLKEMQTRQAASVPSNHSKNLPSLPAPPSSGGPQSNSTTGVLTLTPPTSGTSPTGKAPHLITLESKDGQMSDEGHREVEHCTERAECLKLVIELQKAFRQAFRAVAVVPPISQQSEPVKNEDVIRTADDSLPFKIDAVWTLTEDCESVAMENKTPKELKELIALPSVPLPQTQEGITPGNDSVINTESCKMPSSTSGSISIDVPQTEIGPTSMSQSSKTSQTPVSVNDLTAEIPVQQNNEMNAETCPDDSEFHFSVVPSIDFTLEKLQQLIQSLEATPAEKEKEAMTDVIKCIIDLYWDGDIRNIGEEIKAATTAKWTTLVPKMCIKEKQGVVLQYLEPENLKRLSDHCHVLQEDIALPPTTFKSWWNEHPLDIDKVLAEPLSEYDFTWCKKDSESVFDVNAADSLAQLCGIDAGDLVVADQNKTSVITSDSIAEQSVTSDCLSEPVCSPEVPKPATADHQVDVINQEEPECENKPDASQSLKKTASEMQEDIQLHPDRQVQDLLHSNELPESLTKSTDETKCEKDHRNPGEEANSPKAKPEDFPDMKTQIDEEKMPPESPVLTSHLNPSDHVDDDVICVSDSSTNDSLPDIILLSSESSIIIEDSDEQEETTQLCLAENSTRSCQDDPDVLTVFSLSGNREIWSHGPSSHVGLTCPHMTDATSGTDLICPKCLNEAPLLDLDLDESLFSSKEDGPNGMSSPIKPGDESCSPQPGKPTEPLCNSSGRRTDSDMFIPKTDCPEATRDSGSPKTSRQNPCSQSSVPLDQEPTEPLCNDSSKRTESDLFIPKTIGPEATRDSGSPKTGRQNPCSQSSVPPDQEPTESLRTDNSGKTGCTMLLREDILLKSSVRAKLPKALPHSVKAKTPQNQTSLLKYLLGKMPRLSTTEGKPADNGSKGQSSRNERTVKYYSPIGKKSSPPTEVHPYSPNACLTPQVSIKTPSPENVMRQRLEGPEHSAPSDDRQENDVKKVMFSLYGSQSRDFQPPSHSRLKFPPAPVYINVSASPKTGLKYTGLSLAKRKAFSKSCGRFVQKRNNSLSQKGQKECEILLKNRIEIQKNIMRARSNWKALIEKEDLRTGLKRKGDDATTQEVKTFKLTPTDDGCD